MTHSWIRTLQYGNISPTTSNTTTTASTTNLRKGFSSSNKYTTNPADAGGAGAGAGSTSDNIESNNDINDTTNENGPTAAKAQFRAAAKDLIQHIRDTKNATESDNPRFMDEIEATLNSQDFALLLWNKKTDFQKFQRIEFLGERALRTVIARMLYERYPEEREGYLAKRCNALLSRETCSDIAQKKELRNYLTIALGKKPSFNPSILHSAMEALIGALYLDWGLEPAASFIHCYWATLLEQPVVIPPTSHKNTLQELAQSMTLGINPVYETLEHSGCDSASWFKVRVTLGGIGTAMGTGSTKRDAEQRAARTLLHEIIILETPLKPVGPPPNKNPKNALQEHAQSIPLRSRPVYETLKQSGPNDAPSFKVLVTLEGVGTAKGTGSTKRDAEYMAARTLLAEIMNLETSLENQAVVLPPHDKGPKTTLQELCILTPKGSIVPVGDPMAFLAKNSSGEDGVGKSIRRLECCLFVRTTSSSSSSSKSNENSRYKNKTLENSNPKHYHAASKRLIEHIRDNGKEMGLRSPRFFIELAAALEKRHTDFWIRDDLTDFDRLEFLGDRVLGIVIAHVLYGRYPDANAGNLATRFDSLICREACLEVAKRKLVRDFLEAALGKTGPNSSTPADAIEALIGALYLDGGYEVAYDFIYTNWAVLLENLEKEIVPPKEPKGALQELVSSKLLVSAPVYDMLEHSGPDHAPQFKVRVSVEGLGTAIGTGPSKRYAEQMAARILLSKNGTE